MKTAMQKLLEEVIYAQKIAKGIEFRSALEYVRDAIELDYLEKEKEVIVDAWDSAYGGDSFHDGDDYYNETFNTKEK